jgi:hypothetical protein
MQLNNKLAVVMLSILVLSVYFSTLNCGFVLDDAGLVVHNPFIKSFRLLPKVFLLDSYRHWLGELPYNLMYRPLQALSYFLDMRLWGGLNPSGFHFANILFHAINSILVYFLILNISGMRKQALIAGALFAAHPAQSSVVSYISGRADLLSAMFMLASALSFLKFLELRKKTFYILSLLCAGLALFSRENALGLFIFILLMLFLQQARPKMYFYVLPFLILAALYVFLRAVILGYPGLLTHPSRLMPLQRLLNFSAILFEYIKVLILPVNMHLFRSVPFVQSLTDTRLILSLLFILGMSISAAIFRKNKFLIFGLAWFTAGLLPAYLYLDGFPDFKQAMMAESWLYLATAGYFSVLAVILSRLKRTGALLASALVIFYALLTFNCNKAWVSNLTLDKATFKYISRDNPLRKILIDDYLEAGLYDQARSEIEGLEKFYPDTPLVNIAQGNYYLALNRPQEAIESYNLVFSKSYYTCYKLSLAYAKLNNENESRAFSLLSFRLNPYFEPNLLLLGENFGAK